MSLPIKEHPSFAIKDASKISLYQECARKYFMRHMLGWELDTPNIHLVFGKAVHKAMEIAITAQGKGIKTQQEALQIIIKAEEVFNDIYRKDFPEETDQQYYPKVPGRIPDLIAEYLKYYREDEVEERVLYTEVAGTVPITNNSVAHFRIDAIRENDLEGVYVLEHKTGSKQGRQFEDQFYLKTQTGMYTHVLYALFPQDWVYGVKINGLIFLKGKTEFVRIPIRKQPADMEMWLWETQQWVKEIEDDTQRLSECTDKDYVMKAFKRNPENCVKWFGCPYLEFCKARNNPLVNVIPPPGFKQEWWDPRDEESSANKIINL